MVVREDVEADYSPIVCEAGCDFYDHDAEEGFLGLSEGHFDSGFNCSDLYYS